MSRLALKRARGRISTSAAFIAVLGATALSAAPAQATPLSCRVTGVYDHTTGQVALATTGKQICTLDTPAIKETEHTLVVSKQGNLFSGITTGTGSGIAVSTDQGENWSVSSPMVGKDHVINPTMGQVEQDPITGRLVATGLTDFTCPTSTNGNPLTGTTEAWSDDQGKTWNVVQHQLCGGGDWGKTFFGKPATAADAAALAASGYKGSVIYHCNGGSVQVTRFCWRSTDGAKNWTRVTDALTAISNVTTNKGTVPVCTKRLDPGVLASMPVTDSKGRIIMTVNACSHGLLISSSDGGRTWTQAANELPAIARSYFKPFGGVAGLFTQLPVVGPVDVIHRPVGTFVGPVLLQSVWGQMIAIDSADNLYIAWADPRDDQVDYSVSRDGGATWSPRTVISAPGIGRATDVSIKADRATTGKVALAYYAAGADKIKYDGYLSVSTNALDANPSFTTASIGGAAPLQPNTVEEPIEYAGVDFGTDGSVWGSFSRDECVTKNSIPLPQCDASFLYDTARYHQVIAHLK